jgi:DNA-binding transcriptional LysR family regulator
VLARTERIADLVQRAARGEQGRLAIGFTSSAALHPIVPAALLAFRAARPGVRTKLEEAGTMELVDAMVQGRLDAAFVRTPVGSIEGLVVDHVLEEPMVAALPAGHDLVRSGAPPLPLAALAVEPFVLYRRPAGPGLYDAIVTACRGAAPCCMNRWPGRTCPCPRSGSRDSDVFRPSELEHVVQHPCSNGHLGRLPPIGLRAQPVADDALPP